MDPGSAALQLGGMVILEEVGSRKLAPVYWTWPYVRPAQNQDLLVRERDLAIVSNQCGLQVSTGPLSVDK